MSWGAIRRGIAYLLSLFVFALLVALGEVGKFILIYILYIAGLIWIIRLLSGGLKRWIHARHEALHRELET